MKRLLIGTLLVAPILLTGCQDENPLTKNFSFTGKWEASGVEGNSILFEFEQLDAVLGGNLFVQTALGELSDPIPILDGVVRGESVFFTYDFSIESTEETTIDTIAFRGTLDTENVLQMVQHACWDDTVCIDVPFNAIRRPSGF